MSSAYLNAILAREAVDTSAFSPVRQVQTIIAPVLQQWANRFLLSISPSGSFAKGTANRSGTDIDLFISLHEDTPETLKDIYGSLFNAIAGAGYVPKRQNASINATIGGFDVDLVPGKRQSAWTTDHSLYRRTADTWTKTNVTTHINTVVMAGHQRESRLLKLWRNQKRLEFPSFYLELTVIAALSGRTSPDLAENVVTVLEYLRDKFTAARVIDPANGNNVISGDLTGTEKQAVRRLAEAALGGNWSGFVQ
ncbi:nucleotidyltransferase domain-containing protein [Sphingobium lactosutens]|uniref:nucleotidyltransferase domain-containing protein n=1 Tax=Sphingobium lactosutens TaxID=522773 RepID=UPI001D188AF0|nr:nucleotidyltransferase domain-containing protein [Sphingobium lactosutens]MCC4254892.1 nucleotidyltransferase domain-containing protein [Sphingobium lactosutens]